MIAELKTRDSIIIRYFHCIDRIDCASRDGKLFFCLREKDGEEHYLPCSKYSLVGLESEDCHGMANN